ncbi:MAG: hypothetical protein ACRCUT_10915, partial [Spirochaetota bacterium]
MKQLKVLAALAMAAAIAAPAMAAPTVTFSGDAKARFGMQYMQVDKDSTDSLAFLAGLKEDNAGVLAYKDDGLGAGRDRDEDSKGMFYGLKNEQSTRLNAKIEDGKLTANFGAEMDSTNGVAVKAADVAYDFGMLKITYSDASLQSRWNADIQYVGDYSGESSLDFSVKPGENMGNLFFTILSDKSVSTDVMYENTDLRVIPMMQLGYEYESDTLNGSVGGVLDKYKGDIDKDDYTGYMGFANVVYKMGKIDELENGSMAFGISGIYGKNTSRFAGMDPADMEAVTLDVAGAVAAGVAEYLDGRVNPIIQIQKGDKDSTVYGAIAFVAGSFWTGGLVSADARYSQVKLSDSDPY